MSKASLAEFLRGAREQRALTLRSVEQSTGVSNAYLSQLENGRIRRPSPVILHKLSALYGTPYAEALRLAGYPVPDYPASESGRVTTSPLARLGQISADEEQQLAEYLAFLRTRQRRGRR